MKELEIGTGIRSLQAKCMQTNGGTLLITLSLLEIKFLSRPATGKLTPNCETEPYTVQTKEGQELTLKSAEGVVHRRNSSFVKPYNTAEEPENPGKAEALTSPVISPLSVTTSETTEPQKRPNRTIKMPAKFKDFVLEKYIF